MYKGQVLAGLVWLFVVNGVYFLSIVGTIFCCVGFVGLPVAIMLHVICLFDAASGR